jgi:large subunit ribosomal protein L2
MSGFFYKRRPCRSLCYGLVSSGGRNFTGRLTLFHRSGPKTRWSYCFVDHSRVRRSSHTIIRFDLNGFRNCYLMLVYDFRYGLAYHQIVPGLRISQIIVDNVSSLCGTGPATQLRFLSPGQIISNVSPGASAVCKFGRAPGTKIVIISSEQAYTLCKLPSGCMRQFNHFTRGLVGSVAQNSYKDLQSPNKAGFRIRRGHRPVVRGVAKNPVDHPHGGGEGKKSPPAAHRSPWGWLTLWARF